MRQLHRYESILQAIGWTPMVRLNRITAGLRVEVWAKLEFFNPMGSVKDRIAHFMVEKAEADGRLQQGFVILEASSGNTALGLALVAIQKGYSLKVVVRDSISPEKIALLRALGADIVFVDATLAPEHPESYNHKAPRLAQELANCYFPDQHNNRENNETHYRTTGPEIWQQMEGRIDYFVAGMGTGGTVSGVGRYLKEQDPAVKVIAVEPEGSVFAEYFRTGRRPEPRRYLLEGLGDEFIIGTADFSPLDDVVQVSDREAFLTARRLAREEGIVAGGSSGAALAVVLRLAPTLPPGSRIVTIFPDSGFRYASTIFNDQWMAAHGFLDPPQT
ncbi:MAG: cysteine synthase family protein [Thermoanaerobaculum sp.]|nr:cysteine synthase family protein [Thermoanaerobaculum sp.]